MSALRRRGQPLASLALVLAGWVGVRAAVWEPPFAMPGRVASVAMAGRAAPPINTVRPEADPVPDPNVGPLPATQRAAVTIPPVLATAREPVMPLKRAAPELLALAPVTEPLAVPAIGPRVAAAHQLLYLAALGRLPLPPGLALLEPAA